MAIRVPESIRTHLWLPEIPSLRTPRAPQHKLSLPHMSPPHPKSSPALPGRVLTACVPWGWLSPKTLQWVEAQVPQQGRDCKPNALIPTGTLPLAQQSRGPCQPFSHFQNHLGRPKVKVGSGFGEQYLRRHQRDGMKGHMRPTDGNANSCWADRCICQQIQPIAGFHKVLLQHRPTVHSIRLFCATRSRAQVLADSMAFGPHRGSLSQTIPWPPVPVYLLKHLAQTRMLTIISKPTEIKGWRVQGTGHHRPVIWLFGPSQLSPPAAG